MRKVNCMLKVTCMRAVIGDPTKQLTTSTKIYIGNRIIMNYSTAMLIFNFLILNLLWRNAYHYPLIDNMNNPLSSKYKKSIMLVDSKENV